MHPMYVDIITVSDKLYNNLPAFRPKPQISKFVSLSEGTFSIVTAANTSTAILPAIIVCCIIILKCIMFSLFLEWDYAL